jgi:hypothetical protein
VLFQSQIDFVPSSFKHRLNGQSKKDSVNTDGNKRDNQSQKRNNFGQNVIPIEDFFTSLSDYNTANSGND